MSDITRFPQHAPEELMRKREPKPPATVCSSTTVESRSDLEINGVHHAGVVTHRCSRVEQHADDFCLCACSHQWKKFGSVK